MLDAAARGADTDCTPPPRLLYTEAELREVRKLQAVALAERHADAGREGT